MKKIKYKLILLLAFMQVFLVACTPLLGGSALVAGVAMESDRRSAGQIIDDKNLTNSADWFLNNDKQLKGRSHINVTAFRSSVLVTGEVVSEDLRHYVETALRKKYPQIIRVNNELVIAPEPASILSISKDTAITSAVLLKFQDQEVFHPAHIKVVTENSTVYLLGAVTKREAEFATKLVSETVGVKKVVKLFEYLAKKPQKELDEEARIRQEKLAEEEKQRKREALLKQKSAINDQLEALN